MAAKRYFSISFSALKWFSCFLHPVIVAITRNRNKFSSSHQTTEFCAGVAVPLKGCSISRNGGKSSVHGVFGLQKSFHRLENDCIRI